MARIEKVNQQLKREVSEIIQRELQDPRLQFVTITAADVSRDLRSARVYFTVLGNTQQTQTAQRAMQGVRGIIRKYIGQRMNMRYTPELFFIYDNSVEISARLESTLKEIENESNKNSNSHQEE